MVNSRVPWIPWKGRKKVSLVDDQRRSFKPHMEIEKRGIPYLRSLRISGEIVYCKVKSWWASVIDKQNPQFRIPLLVLGDVVLWALLLLGGFCLAGLGILAVLLVLGVVLFPFYFMTLYLGWNNLSNQNTRVYGLVELAISNVLLFYLLLWLRMPEGEVLRRKYGIDTEQSPEKIMERFQLISLLVLWLGGSAYASVFCLDLLVVSVGFFYSIYFALSRCYSFFWFLVHTIPLYVIFPVTLFTPLMFISMYRRLSPEAWVPKGPWERPKSEHPLVVVYSPVLPGRLPV
ncbi:unnamed protein product [Calypogeia fissa]